MPNIIEITDFHAPELDPYARLTQNQLRNRLEPEKGIFIAESPKVIDRALDAGYKPVSLLMERKQITGPAAGILSRCGDAPVYTADREMLAELTGFELTRGVLCAFRRPAPRPVEELCKNARRVAVLEGIVDSTNVGAIFRSAAALNMDAVLINPSCCDPLCRRAVRVSMGTVFQVPWGQLGETPADWPEKGMDILHSLGFKTAAMALSDRSVSIDDEQLAKEPKLAIVLGTEGDGLAAGTIASCDYTVKIPMSHGVDSLNVAAASAVAFWQLGRQYKQNSKTGPLHSFLCSGPVLCVISRYRLSRALRARRMTPASVCQSANSEKPGRPMGTPSRRKVIRLSSTRLPERWKARAPVAAARAGRFSGVTPAPTRISSSGPAASTSRRSRAAPSGALGAWPLVRMVERPRARAASSAAKGSRQTSKARWRVQATGRPALWAAARAEA